MKGLMSMRTYEQQAENIRLIRNEPFCQADILQRIRTNGYCKEDIEKMESVIFAPNDDKAMKIYNNADTAVRERLQYLIDAMQADRQQIENIQYARNLPSYKEDILKHIRTDGYGETDKEKMESIICAPYDDEAIKIYANADTAVRDHLQHIISSVITIEVIKETHDREDLEKRYEAALDEISDANMNILLDMPEPIKTNLMNTTDLVAKTEFFEVLAKFCKPIRKK